MHGNVGSLKIRMNPCSKNKFVISVCESIIKWNEAAHGRKSFLESLNVNVVQMLLQDSEKKTVYDYQMQSAKYQKNTRNADKKVEQER